MTTFRDLRVYQVSYRLALDIHKLTQSFPSFERVELGRQLRRASSSIPANIAEGYGRNSSTKDFRQFLRMALGSCEEMQVWLDMVKDIGYLKKDQYETFREQYTYVGKMLSKMIKNWQKR